MCERADECPAPGSAGPGACEPTDAPLSISVPTLRASVSAFRCTDECRHFFQVIREVYSGCSGPADSELPPPSSSPVHKAELEKVRGVHLLRAAASQEDFEHVL